MKRRVEEKAIRMIRVRERTFERLKQFGELGEPIDSAVNRCMDLAEKGKRGLVSEVTA